MHVSAVYPEHIKYTLLHNKAPPTVLLDTFITIDGITGTWTWALRGNQVWTVTQQTAATEIRPCKRSIQLSDSQIVGHSSL